MKNTRGSGLRLRRSAVKIVAHNPQHEEAVEELEAELNFEQVAIGFNVTYLLDALNAIEGDTVVMALKDAKQQLSHLKSGGW